MFSLGTRLRPETRGAQPPVAVATDENTFLAAALAAALVEYRRYVQQGSPPSSSEGETAWRTVARVERLMGQAALGR